VIEIWVSPLENCGKFRVFATEIEANLSWVYRNPTLVGFNRKVRVWVLPENSAKFWNSNSNFDRGESAEIPLMAKLNCLELAVLVTLSMMKVLLDQALLGTLNVSEKFPC
jgi:hypothetical protein